MPSLTCYRLSNSIQGRRVRNFSDLLDLDRFAAATYGPYEGRNFRAFLVIIRVVPHEVAWESFLRQAFDDALSNARSTSPSALLIVEIRTRRRTDRFAFPFGPSGRFLIASDGYERGYGLRAALNLIYPRAAAQLTPSRLRAVDTKRRGTTTTRSRVQAAAVSTFELFNVDHLQDVVNSATGVPADLGRWGRRVTGGDALGIDVEIAFTELGDLCREIERAHSRDDYQDDFDWIDFVRPVSDPRLRTALEQRVVQLITSEDSDVELAPPQIIDWDLVSSFHYHFDRAQGPARQPVTHPDLRMEDYFRGLDRHDFDLAADFLKSRQIRAVDSSGNVIYRWPVWRCIVGQFVVDHRTYIIDEGQFFEIRADYLSDLDNYISTIGQPTTQLPSSRPGTTEGKYNEGVAAGSSDLLLMDKQLVRLEGRTSPVEVCDLLSRDQELIHVKRHLGSSDLSHLFSQGFVSAELIQMNPSFRSEVSALTESLAAGRAGFSFFGEPTFSSQNYTIVYAIVADWRGRSPTEALPFFSKVNLRAFAQDLRSREFLVALMTIEERP